jgi:RNA polymerase sigma-70 factor (sigma-E family)
MEERSVVRVEAGAIRLDGGQLAELYERYASEAGKLAYLLTGDRELAEDLVQDAFVKLTGRFVHLRDPNGLHAYLRKTVVNLARSYHRRRAVERRFAERQAGELAAAAFDPSDRDVLQRALLSLPLRQRMAIVLRYYEDLDVRETASIMRCSEGTVKALTSRGTDRLRPVVGAEIEDDSHE